MRMETVESLLKLAHNILIAAMVSYAVLTFALDYKQTKDDVKALQEQVKSLQVSK